MDLITQFLITVLQGISGPLQPLVALIGNTPLGLTTANGIVDDGWRRPRSPERRAQLWPEDQLWMAVSGGKTCGWISAHGTREHALQVCEHMQQRKGKRSRASAAVIKQEHLVTRIEGDTSSFRPAHDRRPEMSAALLGKPDGVAPACPGGNAARPCLLAAVVRLTGARAPRGERAMDVCGFVNQGGMFLLTSRRPIRCLGAHPDQALGWESPAFTPLPRGSGASGERCPTGMGRARAQAHWPRAPCSLAQRARSPRCREADPNTWVGEPDTTRLAWAHIRTRKCACLYCGPVRFPIRSPRCCGGSGFPTWEQGPQDCSQILRITLWLCDCALAAQTRLRQPHGTGSVRMCSDALALSIPHCLVLFKRR